MYVNSNLFIQAALRTEEGEVKINMASVASQVHFFNAGEWTNLILPLRQVASSVLAVPQCFLPPLSLPSSALLRAMEGCQGEALLLLRSGCDVLTSKLKLGVWYFSSNVHALPYSLYGSFISSLAMRPRMEMGNLTRTGASV
jgi:hypothetical protein